MPEASPGYDAATVNGDLTITSGVITGPALTVQRVGRRIATHLNEALTDRFAGIDWLAWFQTMPVDIPLMVGLIREQIDTCPGIARTDTLDGSFDRRAFVATFSGQFTLTTGEAVSLGVTINGTNGNPALTLLLLQPSTIFP